MATGKYEGMDAHHPDFRAMFTRESLLASDWYRERLEIKQQRDIALWTRHTGSLRRFLDDEKYADEAARLGIAQRLENARAKLDQVSQPEYLASLVGTVGADPLAPFGKARPLGELSWGKARLADTVTGPVQALAGGPARVAGMPSLLQRFTTRLLRSRAGTH
jgi:hypothetical protein